jgi:tetratricopeptide (TPR) repeat protein
MEKWAARRKETSPGPFGDTELLDRFLKMTEEDRIEVVVQRMHGNATAKDETEGLPNEWRERWRYVFAGLVAAWKDEQLASEFPEAFSARFPEKPSKQVVQLALEAARLLIDQVLTRYAELKFIWDDKDTRESELHQTVSRIKKILGKGSRRDQEYWEIRRKSTRSFDEWCAKGCQADAQEKKQDAIAFYEKALEQIVPQGSYLNLPTVYCNLMSDYAAVGKLDEARDAYQNLKKHRAELEKHPHRGIVFNFMAWYLYEHGSDREMNQALEFVDRSLGLTGDSVDALDTKIRILLRMGKQAQARKVLSQALACDPDHPALKDVQENWNKLSGQG